MRHLALAIAAFFMLAGAAYAQGDDGAAADRQIAQISQSLSKLSIEFESGEALDPAAFEHDVRALITKAHEQIAPLNATISRAENSLALLGPAPKEGAAAEAPDIAAERQALNERVASLRGQQTRILSTIDDATRLLGDFSGRRLRTLYANILKRDAPLILPGAWTGAIAELGVFKAAFAKYFSDWSGNKNGIGTGRSLVALLAAFIVSFLMFGPVRDFTRRSITARLEARTPTPARRVAAAGVNMVTRIIPGVAGGLIIIETARYVGLLGQEGEPVARAVWVALLAYLLVDGFMTGLFAPKSQGWRLAPVNEAKGKRAGTIILGIVAIVGLKSVFVEIAHLVGDADALIHIARGIGSAIVGGLFFLFCEKRLWTVPAVEGETAAGENKGGASEPVGFWPVARFIGRLIAITIIAAAFAGHVNLADFVATRLYYLALIATIAWFGRAALKEIAIAIDRRMSAGKGGKGDQPTDEQNALQFWIGAVIDLLLIVFITPILFVLAGFDIGAVRDLFMRALVGFRVGGIVVSLSDIFFAVATFVGILFVTRLIQGALQRGPLAHSRIDPGIKNSLTTLFGYAGLVIAALISLGVAGLDLSNLAIIAGALSVGIGFGLQSIVNNFVSGLILLFERPVKVGDWIVTTSGEGIVKRISVRSTEIETFDRAAIIVPNSELVASTVTNWTHKSALGRIRIPIGVSYDADPEIVREILLECANAHPLVVRYPEPFVVWQDFGASSLNFELRAFLSDIAKGLQVKTDLRYAIFRAFTEKGIEIPFPQQDIHIRSTPKDAPAPLETLADAQKTSSAEVRDEIEDGEDAD